MLLNHQIKLTTCEISEKESKYSNHSSTTAWNSGELLLCVERGLELAGEPLAPIGEAQCSGLHSFFANQHYIGAVIAVSRHGWARVHVSIAQNSFRTCLHPPSCCTDDRIGRQKHIQPPACKTCCIHLLD